MPIRPAGCAQSRLRPAALALTLVVVSLAVPAASAQSAGWPQSYSLRWYGHNFYDGQRDGPLAFRTYGRKYHSGYYGPAMLYGRQYAVENPGQVVRDLPRAPRDPGYWHGRY